MKHGWHHAINKTVRYYQTPFNLALILKEVSTYNNFLRDQVSMEIAAHRRQNNMIREENIFKSRMSTTANEHTPNGLDDNNINKDIKFTNEDKQIQPKKYMPITHLHVKKEDLEENNNKNSMLIDEDKNDQEEEDEMKENKSELKGMKD